jgi:hypothetical protein
MPAAAVSVADRIDKEDLDVDDTQPCCSSLTRAG